jgi:hypothetical protein
MEKEYYTETPSLILGLLTPDSISNINPLQKKSLEICFTSLETCKNNLEQILIVAMKINNYNYSDFLKERIEDLESCKHDIELKLKQ